MVRKRQCYKGVTKSIATIGNSKGNGPEMRNIWGCFGDKKEQVPGAEKKWQRTGSKETQCSKLCRVLQATVRCWNLVFGGGKPLVCVKLGNDVI